MKVSPRNLVLPLLLLCAPLTADAGYSLVTSRAALGATDSIDWGVLGPSFTDVSNPFTISSAGGTSVTVSQPSGDFERRDQDNGWAGNFSPGDHLLWDAGNGPTVTLNFGSTTIAAGGANIQADDYGAFVARITALDSLGNVLASFTEAGNSTPDADGSAIFIGISSMTSSISQIVFSLDSASGAPNDFAINTFGFTPTAASVPEPASVVMLGVGLAGALTFVRLRRR